MTEFEAAALSQLIRIADALERLAPTETADPVLLALGETFGRDSFTASEAIAAAAAARDEAQAAGMRTPNLPHELQRAGIESAHALGRFLGSMEGRGVVRICRDRAGTLWQLVFSRDDENTKVIPQIPRSA